MKYTLRKKFTFEASHQLHRHDGKCQRLHGHSWVGFIELEGEESDIVSSGPKENMLMDYSDMSKHLKPLVEGKLDHWHLNETLESDMPTSEFVAKWIFNQLKPMLPMLKAVIIEETCTSQCRFTE